MIGKWIDGLTDVQKDRIIEGQGWCPQIIEMGHSRCLVGHAIGGLAAWREIVNTGDHRSFAGIGTHFDDLVVRFGLDRIVRACKLRAAKSNVVAPLRESVLS